MKNRQHSTFNIQHSTLKGWVLEERSGRTYDLEDRLLEFAAAVIELSENLPANRAGNHVAGQILRSGTAAYPNHGEAEAAESRDDFIHKLKICLKELRETRRWARLVHRMRWVNEGSALAKVLNESDQLVRIFHSSIQTARHNAAVRKQKSPSPTCHPNIEGN